MTIQSSLDGDIRIFTGLSTDTKPTVDSGNPRASHADRFYELDTGYKYIFDGIAWQLFDVVQYVRIASGEHIRADWGVAQHIAGPFERERCAAATATVLGNTGGVGDLLHSIRVEASVTSVVIKDGSTTVYTWTVAAGEPRRQEFDWVSETGAWEVTATGGAVVADGIFTA